MRGLIQTTVVRAQKVVLLGDPNYLAEKRQPPSPTPKNACFNNEQKENVVDDDDGTVDSLESFDNSSWKKTSSAPAHISSTFQESAMEKEWMSHFRRKLACDPISKMHTYYQKMQVVNIGKNFREEYILVGKERAQFWHVTFQCPLEKDKILSSSLPLQSARRGEALKVYKNEFLGRYTLDNQGKIYFANKKNARRCCAAIFLMDADSSTAFDVSKMHDSKLRLPTLPQQCNVEENRKPRKATTYPDWVNMLFDMGVSLKEISYHEYWVQEKVPHEMFLEHKKICCHIVVGFPFQMTIVGLPFSSRKDARSDAIALLKDVLVNEHFQLKDLPIRSSKEEIMRSESNSVRFVRLRPKWITSSFPEFFDDKTPSKDFFLYELKLTQPCGKSLLGDVVGLDDANVTPIGILFAEDISIDGVNPFDISKLVIPFTYRDGGKLKSAFATLSKRTVIHSEILHSKLMKTSEKSKLQVLQQFNVSLRSWKTYGMVVTTDGQYKFEHTCLFVPLVPPSAMSDRLLLSIDWDIIRKEFQRGKNTNLRLHPRWRILFVGEIETPALILFTFTLGILSLPSSFFSRTPSFSLPDIVLPIFCLLIPLSLTVYQCFTHPRRLRQLLRKFFISYGKNVYVVDQMNEKTSRPFIIQEISTNIVTATRLTTHCTKSLGEVQGFTQKLDPSACTFLPIPRDTLHVMEFSEEFLLAMERNISFTMFSHRAIALEKKLSAATCKKQPIQNQLNVVVDLFKAASTVRPIPKYERLEFLGDSVLGFFIAINIWSLNSSFRHHEDSIRVIIQHMSRNCELTDGFLRLGAFVSSMLLSELVHLSPSNKESFALFKLLTGSRTESCEVYDVKHKTMADAFESILGALFLSGLPTLIVSLLKNAKFTIPATVKSFELFSFPSSSPCLNSGFDFDHDERWKHQLKHLSQKCKSLSESLRRNVMQLGQSIGISISRRGQFLFSCALCNNEKYLSLGDYETSRFLTLRHSLCTVGSYALQLQVSHEVYKRYPHAQPNDLHLLRASALTDDVIGYIMIKNCLHGTLASPHTKAIALFEEELRHAEEDGRSLWKKNGGWFVGIQQFRNRSRNSEALPRYPGICGGRLFGNSQKINEELSHDLASSFKAIFGALTIVFGADEAWKRVRIMFDEIFLLSANETRKNCNHWSSLVSSYK
jgi:dsRNA-specific ribonuclease